MCLRSTHGTEDQHSRQHSRGIANLVVQPHCHGALLLSHTETKRREREKDKEKRKRKRKIKREQRIDFWCLFVVSIACVLFPFWDVYSSRQARQTRRRSSDGLGTLVAYCVMDLSVMYSCRGTWSKGKQEGRCQKER